MDAKELRKRTIIGQQQVAQRLRKEREAQLKREEEARKAYYKEHRQEWLDELQAGIAAAADRGNFTYTLRKTFYAEEPWADGLMYSLAKEFPYPDFDTHVDYGRNEGVGSDPGPTSYAYTLWISWKER